MKQAVEMTQALGYKLRMFGVPIYRHDNTYSNNEAIFMNATIPEYVLGKKHHSRTFHMFQESLSSGMGMISK